MDRVKVVTGLSHCEKHDGKDCPDCPYFNVECIDDLCADALDLIKELLKEQEHKDKIFHALEDDWKRLKELLKEKEERIETLESLRRIEQEGR